MAPRVTSESIRRGRVAATLKASRSLNGPAGSRSVVISNRMQVQQPSGNAAGAAEVGHASRSQRKVADLIFYPIRPMAFAESAFVSEQRKETAAETEARRRQSLSGVLTEVSVSVTGTIGWPRTRGIQHVWRRPGKGTSSSGTNRMGQAKKCLPRKLSHFSLQQGRSRVAICPSRSV